MPTIDQINDGKHLYRCLEAYFALYSALYMRYTDCFIDKNQTIERDLRAIVVHSIAEVSAYSTSNKDTIGKMHDSMQEVIDESKFVQLQDDFDSQLSNQSRYFRNFSNCYYFS